MKGLVRAHLVRLGYPESKITEENYRYEVHRMTRKTAWMPLEELIDLGAWACTQAGWRFKFKVTSDPEAKTVTHCVRVVKDGQPEEENRTWRHEAYGTCIVRALDFIVLNNLDKFQGAPDASIEDYNGPEPSPDKEYADAWARRIG